MLRAHSVESLHELAALEQQWWALWARSPGATPFQSPAWLLPWARVFAPEGLRTLAIFRAEHLVALAPLYLNSASSDVLPLGISLSDLHDVLIDPGEPEAGAMLVAELAERLGPRNRIVWPDVPPGSVLETLALPPALTAEWHAWDSCPTLPLDGTAEPIRASKRRKLRMAWHRAGRRGDVQLVDAMDSGIDRWLDGLVRLHGARWRTKGEHGVLADDAVRDFHRQAGPALMRAGLLDARMLYIGGELAGAYYGLAAARKAFAYLGGFDPRFEHESPGTILMGDAIERAQVRGCSRFSFLRGRETYKYDWGAEDVWSRTLVLTRSSG